MKNGNIYIKLLQLILQPVCFIGKTIAIALISGYRYFISPLFPASCRFYPTCSAYALDAFKLHGVWKGFQFTLRRILKCHPWHTHSICYDPVPISKKIKGAS